MSPAWIVAIAQIALAVVEWAEKKGVFDETASLSEQGSKNEARADRLRARVRALKLRTKGLVCAGENTSHGESGNGD